MIKAKDAAKLADRYTTFDINNIIECNARLGNAAAIIPESNVPANINTYQLVYSLNKAEYDASFLYDDSDNEYYIIVSWANTLV